MLHKSCAQPTDMIEAAFPRALTTLALALWVNPELPLPLSRRELQLDADGKAQIQAGCGSLGKR